MRSEKKVVLLVVAAPEAQLMATALLPPGALSGKGGGRTYHIYGVNGPVEDREFRDPIEGSLLLSLRGCSTFDAAKKLAEQDALTRPR